MAQNDRMVETDIFRAAEGGNIDKVEMVLAHGENVNISDAWGNSLLYLAAWGGHAELVRCLLDRGARTDMSNIRGQTSLHKACERGHSGVARMLIERGAAVDPVTEYLPPLHFAMFHCNSDLVDQLMKRGANIDRADADGATTLHRACWCDCDRVVKMLLDRGANIELKNRSGMTALDYAIVYGHSAVVDVFINKFPDMIHLQDTKGWTRLHKACADNNTTLVRCLLNSGADIDLVTNYGSTPLHLALKRGSFEVAEILIGRGAKVEVKDNKGNTPLHEAAVKLATNDDLQISVFRKLLDRGACVDVKNINNDTSYDLCQKDERYHILVEHVTKLRVAGLFVDLKNTVVNQEMEGKCLLELKQMTDFKIFENTSLKVVFSKVQNPYYLKNDRLRFNLDGFLQSSKAKECFPLYNKILKNTLHRSICRLDLMIAVNHSLTSDERNQWWNSLPALVQDYVLLYLNIEDLEKLEQTLRSENS